MLTEKKLESIEKILGKEKIESLDSGQVDELQITISNAAAAIKTAQDELDANPLYQELKENLKVLSAGMKEVKKFQNAVIQYSLNLIEEKGKL